MTDPTPPTNVQLRYPGGRNVPVDCVYQGIQDGIHLWLIVAPETIALEDGMRVTADTLPAKTSVVLALQEDA